VRMGGALVGCALALCGLRAAAADDDGFLGKARLHLAIEDCGPGPALDDKAIEAQAKEHYDRGVVLYLQGDYDGAIAELTATYCLLPRASWLKDIGQAYERLTQYELAVAYLERFVREAPTRTPGELTERRNASSRIAVLKNLRSAIKVATEPPGAFVTVANEQGVRGTERANSDRAISLVAGDYTMTIEAAGFDKIEQPLEIGIGKPYSFSYRLTPRRGRLRIQTVPGDARILVDDRLVGLGSFDGEADLGLHEIDVDATGWVTGHETIEVVDGAVASATVELEQPPANGRWLAIIGATALGGYVGSIGGLITNANTDDASFGAGLATGLAAGAIGGYLLVPRDLRHGTASFVLTSAVAGTANGTLIGSMLSDDQQVASTISLGGTAVGAATAAILLSRFDVDEGQAAVYNSGMVWGFASGTLFAQIFGDPDDASAGKVTRTQVAITLAGANLGLVTGALLATRYQVSRRRVIYIDLAGAAGLVAGLALQNAASSAGGAGANDESRSHFTLAGMVVGLGVGTFLTRNVDAPRLPKLHPQITPVQDASGGRGFTLGFAGSL